MAVVQGIREKVHLPLYDSLTVEPRKQLREVESSSTLRFFMNVQNKTKLETNLQSASLLPHYNTFEARAMRVVISDLPPDFPDEGKKNIAEDLVVTDENDRELKPDGTGATAGNGVRASFEGSLASIMKLLREMKESNKEELDLDVDPDDEDITLKDSAGADVPDKTAVADAGGVFTITKKDLELTVKDFDRKSPPREQISPNNGAGTLIGKLIYNTVTTFYVGEKIMIQMPTWFFPAGAGPYSEAGKVTTHGEPSPNSTFRFAEPIFIDRQQNFRVEMEIPDADVLKEIHQIYGPLFIWVVIDGFMTRGVQ